MTTGKRILAAALLFLFSALIAGGANAQTAKSDPSAKPTFVIVHGAWGGSWAFRRVEVLLREKGCTVYRPSLTGQGERVHLASPEVGLSTHINDVVNTILFEDLHDIVLVGHSYGGMVITGVADRVPDRIKRVIYLDAFVPENGDSAMTLFGRNSEWVKQMTKDGFIVPAWVKADQPAPKDVPQSLKTFTDTIVLKNQDAARKIPTTYILTVDAGKDPKDDDFASQAARAKAKGWPVFQLQADHNPQWSAPEALVEMLYRNR